MPDSVDMPAPVSTTTCWASRSRSAVAATASPIAPFWRSHMVRAMQYTRLGRTALRVSRVCLGTMNFGPQTSEADSFAIMDRALEHGINFFDTANRYGGKVYQGMTEQNIGRWLPPGGGRRRRIGLAAKGYGGVGAGADERGR